MYKLSRRQLITLSGVTLTAAGGGTTALLAMNNTTEELEVVYRSLKFSLLKGLKIGFITDIHFGIALSDALLYRVVNELNNEKLDLLLLGGDYIWTIDYSLTKYLPRIRNTRYYRRCFYLADMIFSDLALVLSDVKTNFGTFGVLGNHDNLVGKSSCINAFKAKDIVILDNKHTTVNVGGEKIELFGVDDYVTGTPEFPKEVYRRNIKEDNFKILLCHNPDYVGDLLTYTDIKIDLALCGHTHGGQINLPFFSKKRLINIYYDELACGYKESPKINCYTSRGIGTVHIPYRIACRPEITVFKFL
jgi:uncharacterized protein